MGVYKWGNMDFCYSQIFMLIEDIKVVP